MKRTPIFPKFFFTLLIISWLKFGWTAFAFAKDRNKITQEIQKSLDSLKNNKTILAKEKIKSAQIIYQKALKAKSAKGQIWALQLIMDIYKDADSQDSAIYWGQKALTLCKERRLDTLLADTQYRLAIAYAQKGDLPMAITQTQNAWRFFAQKKIRDKEAGTRMNLALFLISAAQPKQALKHLAELLESPFVQKDAHFKSQVAINIGVCYHFAGERERAENAFQKALTITAPISARNTGVIHTYLAQYAGKKQNWNEAEGHFQKAISLFEEVQSLPDLAGIYGEYAEILLAQGKYDKARIYLERGLQITSKTGIIEDVILLKRKLAHLMEKTGNFRSAYQYLREATEAQAQRDSISKMEIIAKLQAQYELQLKEQKIRDLKEKQALNAEKLKKAEQLRNSLAGSVALLIFALALTYNRFIIKKKYSQKLESQNQIISSQNVELENKQIFIERQNQELKTMNDELFLKNNQLYNANENIAKQNQKLAESLSIIKKQQEELIEKNRLSAISEMAMNIAHEINSPLGAIKAIAENQQKKLGQTILALLPSLARLSAQELAIFDALIASPKKLYSAIEEREKIRELMREIPFGENPKEKHDWAKKLLALGILSYKDWATQFSTLPLPKQTTLLDSAYAIQVFINGSALTLQSVRRTSKVIQTLIWLASDVYNSEALEDINFCQSLRDALEAYAPFFGERLQLHFECRIESTIKGLPDHFKTLWQQLVSNGLYAMEGKGILSVIGAENEEYIEVRISDTGKGIDETIKPLLFKPFVSDKDAGEGLGLGLFIAREITRQYQGNLTFMSEPGNTVFIASFKKNGGEAQR